MKMDKHELKVIDLPALSVEERDDAALRARDLAWSKLVRLFDHYGETQGLSYQKLGERIKRSRSHVQRWLSSPFNLNLGSLGLLAEGLNADLAISLVPRTSDTRGQNYCHPSEAAEGLLRSRASAPVVTTIKVENAVENQSVVTSSNDRELAVVAA